MPGSPDQDPHRSTPVIARGAPIHSARAALVLLHGRGGSPEDMLSLAGELDCENCALLAPQAAGYEWYPYRFLAPVASNEPWLSSALAKVDRLVAQITADGLPADRIALLGFSQGACLALEYAVRRPQRLGAVIGLSGGLIGPPGTRWEAPASLDGTPVFLGCSDADPHIPKERVDETARVLERLGGQVTERIYPLMGHTVNQDEVDTVKKLLGSLG